MNVKSGMGMSMLCLSVDSGRVRRAGFVDVLAGAQGRWGPQSSWHAGVGRTHPACKDRYSRETPILLHLHGLTVAHGKGRQAVAVTRDGEILSLDDQAKIPAAQQLLQLLVVPLQRGNRARACIARHACPIPCWNDPALDQTRAPASAHVKRRRNACEPPPAKHELLTFTASSSTARMQGRLCAALGGLVCVHEWGPGSG